MTQYGKIYQMVELEIYKANISKADTEGMIKIILPKIQELEPRWIPVEERLPFNEGEYLTCSKEGKYRIAFFRKAINHNNDWYFYIENRNPRKYENSFILVGCEKWMPLPQ